MFKAGSAGTTAILKPGYLKTVYCRNAVNMRPVTDDLYLHSLLRELQHLAIFQYLKWGYKKEGDRLFSRVCCDRSRGNGLKLKKGRFRLVVRKKSFTVRVVRHWNRSPRDVVDVPSLENFSVRLDQALGNLI